MSTRGKCSNVTDLACQAPANAPGSVSTECTLCGEFVCLRCSRVINHVRVCNNCEAERSPRLSRHERLQAAADAGFDTWADYKGEK